MYRDMDSFLSNLNTMGFFRLVSLLVVRFYIASKIRLTNPCICRSFLCCSNRKIFCFHVTFLTWLFKLDMFKLAAVLISAPLFQEGIVPTVRYNQSSIKFPQSVLNDGYYVITTVIITLTCSCQIQNSEVIE